jgi:signal transduction histidine kinase
VTAAWLQAQENERNTIAQELHDNVNQILAGTNLFLSMIKKHPEKSVDYIETSIHNIQTAIEENRKMAHALAVPDFEQLSLTEQLNNLTDTMLKRSGIEVHMRLQDFNEDYLRDEQKLAIYRILQEQCTNIVKYAKAKLVILVLSLSKGIFKMTITDNGRGTELNKVSNGIGLRNIKSRAGILNGETNIITSPGKGFTLEIKMPYVI